ncbi:MAG TPA: DUF2884 family protein [Lysobacter sp.]|nr:DUF2884 family protein [Lysobacter sp.]
MRQLLAFALLSLACSSAVAAEGNNLHCDVESDYDLTLNERSLILTRATGAPRAIVMRQGRLFVDDAWVTLSAADSRRIADFEKGMRATMPLAQAIGRDAVDIAFTALGEVAAGFSSNPKDTQAQLARARSQLDTRLARAVTANRFDDEQLAQAIGEAVKDVVPSLIGDIVGGAIAAAFTGDPTRLKRMENLDAQIEAQVKPRAEALERRAEALCEQMVALDRLDNALEYRHDGQPLNLLDARVERDGAGQGHVDQGLENKSSQ